MPTQYHFWPAAPGFDAWDVARLIQLSAELPVTDVPLASITEIDTIYWFDGAAEQPTVRKVVEHARLLLDGHPTARARQFPVLPAPDYRHCQPGDLP